MTRQSGVELGGFEIVRLLGTGGMGDVYLARDLKLNRNVAVKVLRADVTLDRHRLARFEQEARAASALSHPNICHIYHLGETPERQRYIAMEYVDGETLRDRLAATRLSIRDSLDVGIQIAAALAAAHAAGVVHRDIKPDNVMIRPDRLVKVLDFGVAKLLPSSTASAPHGPTQTVFATDPGSVVGTIDYMAPEQARGGAVDARVDIWALGVVIYEMIAGRRPFTGSTRSDVLVEILDRDPAPLAGDDSDVPAELRRILGKALRKDPEQRYQVVKDLLLDLEALRSEAPWAERGALSDSVRRVKTAEEPMATTAVGESGAVAGIVDRGRFLARARLAVAAVIGGLAVAVAWWMTPRAPASGPAYVLDLMLDGLDVSAAAPALSPDGSSLVYRADGRLWRRELSKFTSTPLPDSSGATYPFWSPDSRQIAFVRDRKVWRLPIDAANAAPVGDAPKGLSGSGAGVWTAGGDLILAGSDSFGLFSTPVQSGRGRDILPLDENREIDFHHVSALPEGRGLLVAIHRSEGSDTVAAVVNGRRHTVLQLPGEAIHSPVYSADGYLLFERATTIPGIWAVRFALDRLATEGAPFLVVPGGWSPAIGANGTLAFVRGWPVGSQLVSIDRAGAIEPIGELHGSLGQGSGHVMALSPDRRRVALSIAGPVGTELWSYDLTRGGISRLSAGAIRVTSPIWTPDGQRIYFGAFGRGRLWNVYWIPSNEAREPAPLLPHAAVYRWPCDISPDGRSLIYAAEVSAGTSDLWLAPLNQPTSTQPLMKTPFDETSAKFSPDGRSIVYVSDESGRGEVYVRAFPIGPERVQVSINGGSMPAWAPDGRAIFYRTPVAMMEVAVTRTTSGLGVAAPKQLFTIDPDSNLSEPFVVFSNDRFLFARDKGRPFIGVILHWSRAIPQLQGAPPSDAGIR